MASTTAARAIRPRENGDRVGEMGDFCLAIIKSLTMSPFFLSFSFRSCSLFFLSLFSFSFPFFSPFIRIEDALQAGRKMVAAGYVLYSSSVVMMLSVGSGVYGFTLDPNFGEFIMSHVRSADEKEWVFSLYFLFLFFPFFSLFFKFIFDYFVITRIA